MAQPVTSLPPWQSAGIEPKRKYKYILNLGDIPAWVIKTSGRPNVNISEGAKHNFMAYEFKYPGKVTWDNVEITLVDPIDFDAAGQLLDVLKDAGYSTPSGWGAGDALAHRRTPSKRKFVNGNLGTVRIQVSYDDLDYGSEELLGIGLTLVYDWAELDIKNEFVTFE